MPVVIDKMTPGSLPKVIDLYEWVAALTSFRTHLQAGLDKRSMTLRIERNGGHDDEPVGPGHDWWVPPLVMFSGMENISPIRLNGQAPPVSAMRAVLLAFAEAGVVTLRDDSDMAVDETQFVLWMAEPRGFGPKRPENLSEMRVRDDLRRARSFGQEMREEIRQAAEQLPLWMRLADEVGSPDWF